MQDVEVFFLNVTTDIKHFDKSKNLLLLNVG